MLLKFSELWYSAIRCRDTLNQLVPGMLFWCGEYDYCRRTVAKPVTLVQPSQSRLGKMNRDSPGTFLHERLPRRPARLLSERRGTRLSEHVSPERDPSALSEGLGKTMCCLDAWLFLDGMDPECDAYEELISGVGETSGVALQWSGCNSMASVSGCPWWCPICITSSGVSSSGLRRGIHHKCKHPLNLTKLYVSG
ncbi:hypothetical protein DEO72_LG7g832 [Vigna unguiculata]|uniref:Uncharacterized protein n=1 Tax=Vigna unguiculata TaxID=3917 RepID=A0A4D6MDQ2_VIGUN|nr:hypothetical protein DEO72_LG7g832 [Vigna unguiculata]